MLLLSLLLVISYVQNNLFFNFVIRLSQTGEEFMKVQKNCERWKS